MKNKKRNIILIIALISISFLIYNKFHDDKIIYLALGDEYVLGKTPFEKYNLSYSDYFSTYLKSINKLKEYDKSFSKNDYRVVDLINDIKNNVKNDNNEYLNQKILKSDIITISIGNNDLLYKIENEKINKNTFDYIDSLFIDMNYLIEIIRKISDCKIFIVGYYYNDMNEKLSDYIYMNYKSLEKYNNVYYVDIRSDDIRYIPNKNNNYPTLEGYNNIYNRILGVINEKKIDL